MAKYNKTAWKDHIKNASGQVTQQGTPLSAGNLNKLEAGIQDAQEFLAKELAQAAAHSGVLEHSAENRGLNSLPNDASGRIQIPSVVHYPTYQNMFATDPFRVLIAGNVLSMGSAHVSGGWNRIDLPVPPATGEREDFVFLEAWRDQATQEWKSRFRVIEGVDFNKYPEGFGSLDNIYVNIGLNINEQITPQGGNDTPPTIGKTDGAANQALHFQAGLARARSWGNKMVPGDMGLYVAGNGSEAHKGTFKTYDGYVYAIPLFKVKRRNTGGFSAANPNGAKNFEALGPSADTNLLTGSYTHTFPVTDTSKFSVGEKVAGTWGKSSTQRIVYFRGYVSNIVANTSVTVTFDKPYSNSLGTWSVAQCQIEKEPERPDGLYANVIADRDVTDLRRLTSLTGWDRRKLLEDNFDKLLRGQLKTKERTKMAKVYHGIRKTPIDANHLFYASLDGTGVAELGGDITSKLPGGLTYIPGVTGAAARNNNGSGGFIPVSGISKEAGTLEAWVTVDPADNTGFYAAVEDDAGNIILAIYANGTDFGVTSQATANNGTGTTWRGRIPYSDVSGKTVHARVTWTPTTINLYVNGKLAPLNNMNSYPGILGTPTGIRLFGAGGNTMSYGALSDVALSKVDRGAVFATIPADFTSGHARIMPAFSNQRQVQSDALTSQITQQIAKVQSATQEKGITVTKGTGTNVNAWEAGDKVKVKGRTGEFIGGIVDTDTALFYSVEASGTAFTSPATFKVNDTAKIAVNDVVRRIHRTLGDAYSVDLTVTAVDAVNKTVTVTWSGGNLTLDSAYYFIEVTASTSSPVVGAAIDGVITAVPGTWTGLGTNEAEFTLGTLPTGLDVEDLRIAYGLNMTAGQGGLTEAFTKTLAGEFKGQALTSSGVQAVMDDLKDKVAGSTEINPLTVRVAYSDQILAPSSFGPGTELTQAQYDTLKQRDNQLLPTLSTNVAGQRVLVLLSYDAIALAEKKYGTAFFKGCLTTADKVQRIKDRFNNYVMTHFWAYGSHPGGNKLTAVHWRGDQNNAYNSTANSGTNSSISQVSFNGSSPSFYVDPNGFMHTILYTEPSDGTTPAQLFLDYLFIEMLFSTKTGYDLLAPENPRRDAGVSNAVYVRRETKEVEVMVPTDENAGLVTYGDYVPYQGAVPNGGRFLVGRNDIYVNVAGTGKFRAANQTYLPYGVNLPLAKPSVLAELTADVRNYASNTKGYSENTYGLNIEAVAGDWSNKRYYNIGSEVNLLVWYDFEEYKAKVSSDQALLVYAALYEINGRLVMRVLSKKATDGNPGRLYPTDNGNLHADFILEGTPLLRGAN